MGDQSGAGRGCFLCCPISGAVVNDKNVRQKMASLLNERSDEPSLVQARNNDSDRFGPTHGQEETKGTVVRRKFLC